jgi:GT2 family glycosyltransferase
VGERGDGADSPAVGPDSTAVVLTYRRPRHAARVVRSLLQDEGVPASQVIVVVNGEGGLDDPTLERTVTMLTLEENIGPAGGFAMAFRFVRGIAESPWIYAREDDGAFGGPGSARLGRVIERVEAFEREVPGPPVGVVVASGWNVDPRTGRTTRHRVDDLSASFEEVDFGAWDATLVSRRVVDAGIIPDESLFWWAEELDFCLRVKRAGFRVLVDVPTVLGRERGSDLPAETRPALPTRADEPWCSYYMARNGFLVGRRLGTARWIVWHLLKSARRFQLAPSNAHRLAILRGLADGIRGRSGRHASFMRKVGEW